MGIRTTGSGSRQNEGASVGNCPWQVLDEAVSDAGSAGGYRETAAGEVPLGIVADYSSHQKSSLTVCSDGAFRAENRSADARGP